MTVACHSWPGLEIDSWGAFAQHAASLVGPAPDRLGFVFRGQADASWDLLPSLVRELPEDIDAAAAVKLETFAFGEFRSQAHLYLEQAHLPPALPEAALPEWWALMQHHHAPTRLLDWTQSPYVGAYFAVEQHPDRDGVMFIVDAPVALGQFLKAWGAKKDISNRDLQEPVTPPLAFFWQPQRRSGRFVAQQGYFSLGLNILTSHGDALTKACASGSSDVGPLRRWIFPAKVKRDILRHLRVMNIGAHALFPGLDGLGRSVGEIARAAALPVAKGARL